MTYTFVDYLLIHCLDSVIFKQLPYYLKFQKYHYQLLSGRRITICASTLLLIDEIGFQPFAGKDISLSRF